MKKSQYLTINVYWFGLAFLWNALHPIVLPALLLDYVPDAIKNTTLGTLTFVGLVLAMFIQPLAGALSDRTRSVFGKRRPWMAVGTLLSLVFLMVMVFVQSLPGLIIGYLLLQIAMNAAHGPAQGLIPDHVPEEHLGMASGIKNLFDMGGLVVTSLVAGKFMGGDNRPMAFVVIAAVLAVSTLITLIGTPKAVDTTEGVAKTETSSIRALLKVDWKKYPAYTRLLIGRFFILLGIYMVQGFAQYFIRDRLGVPNPEEVTGNLMAAIGVTLTLLVFPAGWLSDRIGRKRLNWMAGVLAGVGIFSLIFVKDVLGLYIGGAVIGMATGVFLSVNWALAIDLIPVQEAGLYLGLSNLATAGAGAASRLGGPFIDAINALSPGAFYGYQAMFGAAAVFTFAGAWLLTRVNPSPSSAAVQ